MRALVLTNLYPPHHYGGYELLCRDAVEAWQREGHDVVVMCSDHRGRGRAAAAEVGVERSLRFYWRDFEVLHPPLHERFALERANRRTWQRALDRITPDVVSVWNFGLFGYTLLSDVVDRGIPLVLVIGDLWPCWGPAFDPWTSAFASSRWRRAAGRVVTRATGIATALPDLGAHAIALPASDWLRARIERESPFRFQQITVVPHGFNDRDVPIIEPPRDQREFGWRLLLPGRVDERKGWRTAVQALTLLPQASLTLAGDGQEQEIAAVHELARELGVDNRVRHMAVGRPEMPSLYRGADVVLFPSEWDEPFGMVGLEAMASATPVVATGTGGSAEYLRHQTNCLLFAAGDPSALAEAVERLAVDPALRARLVEGGHRTAPEYTADRTVRALERWHLSASSGTGTSLLARARRRRRGC